MSDDERIDRLIIQYQHERERPVCGCCKLEAMSPVEFSKEKGYFGDEFFCLVCIEECDIKFDPDDYVSFVHCLRPNPEPVPINQKVMF